jgi:hypothetical protein
MKLARMLMVRKDSGYTAIDMLGHEQEGLDALIGLHCVFDSLSDVQATIGCFQKHSIKWASYWRGAKKPNPAAISSPGSSPQAAAGGSITAQGQASLSATTSDSASPHVWTVGQPGGLMFNNVFTSNVTAAAGGCFGV